MSKSDIDFFKEIRNEFNPRTGLKYRYSTFDPKEGECFLANFGGIYLIEIILKTETCTRIKFLEKVPKEFVEAIVGEREVWLPNELLGTPTIVEPIQKDKLRILKINSLGNF